MSIVNCELSIRWLVNFNISSHIIKRSVRKVSMMFIFFRSQRRFTQQCIH